MNFDEGVYFALKTPLNIEIGISVSYWEYLITKKHTIMKDKEDIMKTALQFPDEIR